MNYSELNICFTLHLQMSYYREYVYYDAYHEQFSNLFIITLYLMDVYLFIIFLYIKNIAYLICWGLFTLRSYFVWFIFNWIGKKATSFFHSVVDFLRSFATVMTSSSNHVVGNGHHVTADESRGPVGCFCSSSVCILWQSVETLT